MRADAGEADLARLLGDALSLQQVVGDIARTVLHVEIPDVQVIGPELAQAGIELGQGLRLVRALGLARQHHPLPLALQGRAHHALVVAALIAARGIEVEDPDIGGALDDGGVGSGHAPEGKRGHLKTGLAQGAVGEFDLLGRLRRGLFGVSQPGGGQRQSGGEKSAARGWFHGYFGLQPRL